jgi:uncharacterized phage protein (TIGR01671 family)
MNRTIKFKGISIQTGEWLYGDLVQDKERNRSAIIPQKNGYHIYYEYEVIPETVGQYIGFSDKKGVDIYEGDIVKSNFKDRIFTIVWYVKGFKMEWKMIKGEYVDIYSGEIEVIGNIHEKQ